MTPLPLVSVTSSTVRPSGRVPNTVRTGSDAWATAGIAAQAPSATAPTPRIRSPLKTLAPAWPTVRRPSRVPRLTSAILLYTHTNEFHNKGPGKAASMRGNV